MGEAIGEILPYAAGIGFFPVPVLTVVLVLLSPNARANGLGFVAGWIAGVASMPWIFALATDSTITDTGGNTHAVVSWIKLLLGAGLAWLAIRQWQRRPAPGQAPEVPGWMKRIDALTPGRAIGTGLLLSAGSPKNIVLAAGAGTTIADLGLAPGETALVVSMFTAVASLTTGGPVLYYLLSGNRAVAVLETFRVWLVENLAAIMTVVLLILGTVLIGNGIRGLSTAG